MDSSEIGSRPHWMVLVVLSALLGMIVLPYASAFPSLIVEDDGFFYGEIAKNIALSGFSSFDGLHETSGYHLLWMGVMAALAWVLKFISSSPEFLLWGYLSLSIFVVSLYSFHFFQSLEARLLVFVLSLMCSLLMEMNLLVLVLLPIYSWLMSTDGLLDERRPPTYIYICVLLLPLVRIDAVILLALPGLFILLHNWSLGLKLGLALAAGLLVQVGLMQLIFGDPFSVSSRLKAGGADDVRLMHNLFYKGDDYTLRNLLAIGLIVSSLALAVIQRRAMVVALVLSVVGFYLAHLMMNVQRHWYFLPVYIPLLFVIVRLWPGSRGWQRLLSLGTVGSALIIATGYGLLYQLTHVPARINSQVFIKQADAVLDEDDVVFQVDGSGWVGFFLDAHLVNGDGLVNSYEYARRMNESSLQGYLEEIGASYIIINKPGDTDDIVDRGGLVVGKEEVERVLSTPLESDYRFTQFELYKLK